MRGSNRRSAGGESVAGHRSLPREWAPGGSESRLAPDAASQRFLGGASLTSAGVGFEVGRVAGTAESLQVFGLRPDVGASVQVPETRAC